MLPRLAQGIVDSGVPEQHPDGSGYWNNISQCCGASGVVEFFIAMHAMTGDARHLAFAQRVADDTIARATADGDGLKWIQAEHRVRPEFLVAQTGLMQGAAGVGLALLHLEGAMVGRKPAVVLPDAPLGSSGGEKAARPRAPEWASRPAGTARLLEDPEVPEQVPQQEENKDGREAAATELLRAIPGGQAA